MDPAPMDPAPNVDTLTAALVYLARGWSIVPLVPKTKRPAVTLAPFLSGEQRMTEADTRAYWSERPDPGGAIIMGAPSGAQEETITRLAWWASGTMAPDIALAFLSTWVTRLRTYRLNDPWTLEHVTSRLDRAYQKRALEPGAAGPLVNDTGKAGGG